MKSILISLKRVYSSPVSIALSLSVSINVLFVYYLALLQTTTWTIFWESNIAFYNWFQILLSILLAVLFGIAVSFLFYSIGERVRLSKVNSITTLIPMLFSVAATGCIVCGAVLLPALGVAASLAALPFGGLEIKFLSILFLLYSIYETSKYISGKCRLPKKKFIEVEDEIIRINLDWKSSYIYIPILLTLIFVLAVYALPKLPNSWRIDFRKSVLAVGVSPNNVTNDSSSSDLFQQVNPPEGYEINAKYSDLGPKMLEAGVIDLEKFKQVYENGGQPLTEEQLEILTKGSEENIKISPENSYFHLNFFWALGLGNKNSILTDGDMTKHGDGEVGNFASTGGWSLGEEKDSSSYYAAFPLIQLNASQQELVEEVSSNVYRPCCNNPTSFPDCNHGMALLGILELMASNGATENELYDASKYISAYWFPNQFFDIATYFENTENKNFGEIDSKLAVSKEYASASGWQNTKKWLQNNGLVEEAPKSGGGCGV